MTDFNTWDQRYGAGEFYYGVEPNDFLRAKASRIRQGGRVLCLAEGEGRNAVFLASLGLHVTAVDGSSAGLSKLKALAEERRVHVETVCSDLAAFEVQPGHWDAIVAIWCHLPTNLREKVYAQSVRGLAPGGLFILEAYTPNQIPNGTGGPKDPDLLAFLPKLKQELSGLEFVEALERERDVQEGKGHSGRSAVVQILGRKPAG